MGFADDHGDSHRRMKPRAEVREEGASPMRATGWLLIFACAALLLAHAQGEGEGGSTRTILAVEQAWSEAEARGDKRTLDRIFDNALVYIEDGRLLTKGECLLRLRSAGSHLRQIEAGTQLVQIFGT